MKSKRNVKLVFLALVSSLLLLMASCSDQQPIPSISSAALSVDELIQAADRYEACMTNAGFLM
ncbi:MAG: hypothetical protein LBV30_09635, partial [Propionibacteriaceae bacterium]|nr:hypothetical protein [Propionibacteriaceae bacterium]